jgi:hypothetical protein
MTHLQIMDNYLMEENAYQSSYAGFEGCGVQHKLNVDLAGPDSNTDVPITAYLQCR